MTLAMPVAWSDGCRRHEPAGEVWLGRRTPGTELPGRIDAIRSALAEAGAQFVEAGAHDDAPLLAVHDERLLEYLATAWAEWEKAGVPAEHGADRVVPYVFAHGALAYGLPLALPTAVWARAGYFAYDTMTLIGPGTWEAARAAVDTALTAVDLVARGAPHAYACCRPPGHHACRAAFGGSCYLNTSAVAAQALAARDARVAVLDIDAHHGNGTQEIFWERSDVLVASVHVDPGDGWFPHFLGFAAERGGGAGDGANLNVPLAPGSDDEPWLAAVRLAAEWAANSGAEALVVPLGVDAATGDTESPLHVSAAGFREAGRILGALGLPTVLVQEGGYDLEAIGPLVREVLFGIEQAP